MGISIKNKIVRVIRIIDNLHYFLIGRSISIRFTLIIAATSIKLVASFNNHSNRNEERHPPSLMKQLNNRILSFFKQHPQNFSSEF